MKRPLLYVILAFMSGIFFNNSKFGIAIVAILFILCEIYYYLSKRIKKYSFYNISQTSIFLIFGFMVFGMNFFTYFNSIRELEIKKYDKKEARIVGVINNEGENKGAYWQYILKNNLINGEKISSNILLKSKKKLEYGNKVELNAEMELPKKASNRNTFDYSKYLKTLNIYITAKTDNAYILEESKLFFIEKVAYFIRKKVREFTLNTLNETEAGILNALIIGDESGIGSNLEGDYKRAGMLHLLVVSGGHTVFLIALLKFIFSFLGASKNLSKFLYILIIIVYIFITGATASILRAGIGIIVVMISSLIGRQNDTYTTIGLVAIILIINNPNILFSLSFQLSFGGVLGIVICYPKINECLKNVPKIIQEPLSLTISAQLFVTPITIYSFNTVYLGGIISNIFTLSLSGIIMMGGMVLFILYLLIPPIVFLPVKILSMLIFIMNKIAEIFGNVNWMTQYVITPNIFSIILYYILLFYIFIERKNNTIKSEKSLLFIENTVKAFFVRKKKQIITGLGILCIIILNIKLMDFDRSLKISVIDVGHGDSILITTPRNKNILIDTGDKYYQNNEAFDSGEKTIVPYLLKNRIKTIDMLILTHMDSDHIGGFESIVKAINIKTLALSINSGQKEKYKAIKNIALNECIDIKSLERGDKFKIDNVEFYVLMPQRSENILNENNDSVVLLIKYKRKKALLMGDLEKEGEEVLLSLENDLDIDILKLGHHGSNTSSGSEFINETTPKIALISVGNRFKSIPGKEVLDRLSSVYAKVYRTDEAGEINVIIDNNEITVKTTY